MATKETTYVLKHSPDGLRLLKDRDSDQAVTESATTPPPDSSVLIAPRWGHWYQRKLARPWQATLLGMNLEPVAVARKALKAHDPERYQTFIDRLEILQTLMGYEIEYLDEHVREGDGAGGKYIELAVYCKYAESIGWSGMEHMRAGLKLDKKPPVLELTQRQTDNVLRVLDVAFRNTVPKYFNDKGERSPSAVLRWFESQETNFPLSESTLRNWFSQIRDLKIKDDEKATNLGL